VLAALAGCHPDDQTSTPTNTNIAIVDTPYLPPVYTEQQCLDVVSSFPGWNAVTAMPESDAQGRPPVFYAVIPITSAGQLEDLATVGIDVESQPIFVDDASETALEGQTGVVSKSTCGKYELHWALVPAPIFNAIKTATLEEGETVVDAIVAQPIPDDFADTTITYQGIHPVSYAALHEAGFAYMGVNAPSPAEASSGVGVQRSAFSLGGLVKKVVRKVAGLTHEVPDLVERGIGWIDRQIQGSVKLTVQLDVRNTDPNFGGTVGALPGNSATDHSTAMVQAWGESASHPMQLPGLRVAALQKTLSIGGHGIRTRFEATADASGHATMSITKNKTTSLCLVMENDVATLNDYFTRMEVCQFGIESAIGKAKTAFNTDTTVQLAVQNKYTNVMAQLIDGYQYLRSVSGYRAHKVSVLAGPLANMIGKLSGGRAVTPCLDFPNVPLDILHGAFVEAGTVASKIIGSGPAAAIVAALTAAEVAIEVDMWLPDVDGTLSSRAVGSHEYGHFAMCSLLYDEDSTKMVQIPSLIIQRIGAGHYQHATDQASYIMEGWADFFAAQTASASNYFSPLGATQRRNPYLTYCDGKDSKCLDWNYVEDLDATDDGSGSSEIGFANQVRRVATTLLDAFDGKPWGGNAPNDGDFWTFSGDKSQIVESPEHRGAASDEAVALPGSALEPFFRNWVRGASPLGWRVNEAQFFGALNVTIRAARNDASPSHSYSWCDACLMFAQHDGLSCTETGNTVSGGLCFDSMANAVQPKMSTEQMVRVCEDSPSIPGFLGAVPAGSDPTSACTFKGCPTRSILVGSVGDASATCVACGPHQVSTGTHECSGAVCGTANVSASTCVDCADDQIVGGTDRNTCVSCPPLQVPAADRTSCVACGPHQIAVGTMCVECAGDEIAMPDNTCRSCPAGQVPYNGFVGPTQYGTSCIPASECTCTEGSCRAMNSAGICQGVIG
jgi:hypothetical protein